MYIVTMTFGLIVLFSHGNIVLILTLTRICMFLRSPMRQKKKKTKFDSVKRKSIDTYIKCERFRSSNFFAKSAGRSDAVCEQLLTL